MNYLKRIIEGELELKLKTSGAVLIKGPKWCGKSTTGKFFSNSSIYLDITNQENNLIDLAKNDASKILIGETPRLIDEWQVIPFIWDNIRREIDERNEFGQFILTGSATPFKKTYLHSGIGRITSLIMRPMSLFESLDSDGSVSLRDLLHNKFESQVSEKELDDYAFYICRGGWPSSVKLSKNYALQISKNYFQSLIENDLDFDDLNKNKTKLKLTLKSYARNIGTSCPITTILQDIQNYYGDLISINTLSSYIESLRRIFVIEDMDAWLPNLRSKTAIRTSPTRYFIDPSIAARALNISPEDLFNDFKTFGFLFESLAVRDLRIYAQANGGTVYHFRDKNDFEIDAIIHFDNGSWGACEIKLKDKDGIEKAASNLLKLKSKIDTSKMKEPSFLMVITATKYAYKREDGVYIVPLACLKN